MILSTLGAIIAVVRGRERFAVFASAWAFGITLAYSLINYKTPWLQLNFVLPLALVGGYAIEIIYRHGARRAQAGVRACALALLACALCVGLYQTYELNFVHYDDDRYPYVYAHTQRGYLDLLAKIDELAHRAGTDTDTHINVASPDYWPMPWYLRDYKNVGYLGRLAPTEDALVIINVNQQAEADQILAADYRAIGTYPLRPGVTLVLYARRDIAVTGGR
jgi:predicted membrane-bound mannosyltransferase